MSSGDVSWPEPEKPADVQPWSRADLDSSAALKNVTSEVLRSAFGTDGPDMDHERRVLERLDKRGPWMPAPLVPMAFIWVVLVGLCVSVLGLGAGWVARAGAGGVFSLGSLLFLAVVAGLVVLLFLCLLGFVLRRRWGLLLVRVVLLGWGVALFGVALLDYFLGSELGAYFVLLGVSLLVLAAGFLTFSARLATWCSRLSGRQVRRLESVLLESAE